LSALLVMLLVPMQQQGIIPEKLYASS